MLCKSFLSPTCTMLLLTETVLFYWDFLDDLYQQSIKDNISGVGKIEDWANKITSAKPVHTLIAQCPGSHGRGRGHGRGSRLASQTATNTTNSHLKGHVGSRASITSNARISTAHSNAGLNVPSISYVDNLDEDGSQPPPSTQPELSRSKQAIVTS